MLAPRTLNYATRRPPWHRRKRVWKAILLVILVGSISLPLLRVTGRAVQAKLERRRAGLRALERQRQLFEAQEKCLAYQAPLNQVVYEELPRNGGSRLYDHDVYESIGDAGNVLFSAHVPEEWSLFTALNGWKRDRARLLFLHQLQVRDQRRLVAVEFFVGRILGENRPVWTGESMVIRPATTTMPAEWIGGSVWVFTGTFGDLARYDQLRVFAGQPDPADSSHFTIRYKVNDRPGTFVFWLRADDTLQFEQHDGEGRLIVR